MGEVLVLVDFGLLFLSATQRCWPSASVFLCCIKAGVVQVKLTTLSVEGEVVHATNDISTLISPLPRILNHKQPEISARGVFLLFPTRLDA